MVTKRKIKNSNQDDASRFYTAGAWYMGWAMNSGATRLEGA